jgi:hypothetical protein
VERRQKITIGQGIIIALLLAAISFSSCADKKPPTGGEVAEKTAVGAPKTLKSNDNKLELIVPGSWEVEQNLNSDARLQAADRKNEQALFLISENKQDLQAAGILLDTYAEEGYKPIAAQLNAAKVTGPNKLTIDNNPAVQYQIEGTPQTAQAKSLLFNGPLVYIYTVIESPDNYQQIVAWTTASRFEKNRTELQQLVQGLKTASAK